MESSQAPLRGKTLFITGASRGIGKAIGLRAARDGANVVVAAKTQTPHPRLPGTIHSAAAEMEAAGGRGLAVACDIRDEEQVRAAVAQAVAVFGGIDVLVNNASAIQLTGTAETPIRRFDLMHAVNARGTFLCTQHVLPHLQRAANPHVLTIAPPPTLEARWYAPHAAYTVAKLGMSLLSLGWAQEFAPLGIAVNCLWPRTVIATAALALLPHVDQDACRTPEIMADAAHSILGRAARTCTGNFFVDEDTLRAAGVTDFATYAVAPGRALLPDLFV